MEDRARTTRDRLYAATEWNGRRFVVIDTGGLERRPGDPIEEKVQEQARLAIGEADVILFVVDAASGLTPRTTRRLTLLRRAKVPVIVVANKADNEKRELEAAEASGMGWEETYADQRPARPRHGRPARRHRLGAAPGVRGGARAQAPRGGGRGARRSSRPRACAAPYRGRRRSDRGRRAR